MVIDGIKVTTQPVFSWRLIPPPPTLPPKKMSARLVFPEPRMPVSSLHAQIISTCPPCFVGREP